MGGGKGGKPKVQVTQYSMSIHFGIAARVDAVTGLTYGEKPIWSGRVETNQVLSISQPNLFGGDKKEGGVSGACYVLLGGTDQILPNELSARLSGDVGVNTPGFRGLTSLFFTGYGGPSSGGANPWNLPIFQNPLFSWVIPHGGAGSGFVWTSNTPYIRELWTTVERFPQQLDPTTAKVPTGITAIIPVGKTDWRYKVVDKTDPNSYAASDVDDSAWSIGPSPFGDKDFSGAGVPDKPANHGFSNAPATVVSQAKKVWLRTRISFVGDGSSTYRMRCFIDNSARLYINGALAASVGDIVGSFGYNEVDIPASFFVNGMNTLAVEAWDNDAGPLDYFYFDYTLLSTKPAPYDANPAHIIYECLTDTEWGMGESADNIDIDSFRTAAQTLYDEGFGLSMMWSAESTIEDFVNEVLGHINGVLYTNPRTGKFTLRLTRGDYNPDTLRVVTPDHATMDSFSRKAWGETVNEVKVTWTNPVNEQTETITLQDDGNIAMQGAVVSNSTNYYGIRSARLAMTVCARDLRAASAPLCTAEMTLDRAFWDLAPMDAIKVSWPEYGLNELIMRVTSIDYGSIGEGAITVSLLEDVFNLQTVAYTEPAGSGWSDPTYPPVASPNALVLPAPYFGLAAALGAVDPSTVEDPDTYETVLAAAPTPGAVSYDLSVEVIAANGDAEWTTIDYARNYLGHGELTSDLPAEPVSFFPALNNASVLALPEVNNVVIFGGPDTPVEDIEIALVGNFDADRNRMVLWRGTLDTTPRKWPAGTPIWFGTADAILADPTKRLAGAAVAYRLLTNTRTGQLAIADAPDLTGTALARPSKPLRPADVRAAGVRGEATFDSTAASSIPLSWATRNRLTEDSQILSWLSASVPLEDGATTSIEIVNLLTGASLATIDGLAGDTYSLDLSTYFTEAATLPAPAALRLWLSAKRGTEDSWSKSSVDVWRGVNFACTNAGAESGSTTGWTITGPGSVAASTTQHHSGTSAFVGALVSGTNAVWMTQDVAIPAAYLADVDKAHLLASPLAWVFNYMRAKNPIDIGVAVLDGAGAWLGGRMVSLDDYAGRWQAAMPQIAIPNGARTFRITARLRLRTSGDQCFVDDFQPALRSMPAVAYPLFAHGNPADDGWTATGATLGSNTATGDAGWGLPALTAIITAASNAASFSRSVDVPAGALAGVDAGKATVRYTAALSTLTTVGARLKVEFLDALSTVLGTAYSRGEVGPTTLGELEYDAIDAPIPASTRAIRLSAELIAVTPSTDVAARFNWITAQLFDASGNPYPAGGVILTESGEELNTEDGQTLNLE